MSEKLPITVEHSDGPPDYQQKIIDFLTEVDVQLPEHTIAIMVQGLEEAYKKYGLREGNDAGNEYHNDVHHFEVFQRSVQWLKRFEDYFSIKFKTEDYEVVGIASSWHDNVVGEGEADGVTDEALSAAAVIEAMNNSPRKYGVRIKRRVARAIDATTMEYRDGGVFQMKVMIGKPDYAVVAVALADSSAVLTEDDEKILGDVAKLGMERIPVGSTDITVTTDAVMKILGSESEFYDQRFEDLQKYLLFLCNDPEKVKSIIDTHFDAHKKRFEDVATRIDSRASDIRRSIIDSLTDSKESTDRVVAKVYNGIMRGLMWLPKSK